MKRFGDIVWKVIGEMLETSFRTVGLKIKNAGKNKAHVKIFL